MSQNLQTFVQFQKFQLENLVDFEKCSKTHIYLQRSVPIQPKTSNILPKLCLLSPDVGEAALRDLDQELLAKVGPSVERSGCAVALLLLLGTRTGLLSAST